MWKCKVQIELWLQSCALLVETEALLRRPQEPHYPKKHGIRARECFLFTREFTLALLLPGATGSCSLCCWHDDDMMMIMMMMMLT